MEEKKTSMENAVRLLVLAARSGSVSFRLFKVAKRVKELMHSRAGVGNAFASMRLIKIELCVTLLL